MPTFLFDRSQGDFRRGIVRMYGKDTRRFCNGMFSNNIRDMKAGVLNQNVMLNDKGHVQGQLEVWCLGAEELLVTLEGVETQAFIDRYDRFIIMDEVEQQDISEHLQIYSLQGAQAAEILQELELPVPAQGQFAESQGIRVGFRPRTVEGGFDLLVPVNQAFSLETRILSQGIEKASPALQEWLRISAGIPRWPVDMSEKSLLHELRLVADYANFNKGCYIGQEVINRIDVMGQVNKKLHGLELPRILPDKSEVFLGETVVGTLGSQAQDGDQVRALAILRKAAWTPGLEVHVGEERVVAVVRELPWA